ncbi:hypothetical protein AAG906_035793 [Vitis piasezkii]
MEDFVGEQQKINSHLNEKIDNLESSMNVRMERVYNDLSLRIEKVQDSIEKLTNLDIARGKRKLPPQPHHNLQGTNAKRSRKVLMIDTLVGDCFDNFMDQPSIENHKVQDDKGYDASKIKVMVKKGKIGRKVKTEQFASPHFSNCWAYFEHFRSSFHAYYISFQSLGSQESIASNGARFGVETKKLWPFEDNYAKLNTAAPILLLLDTFWSPFGAQIIHTISLLKLRKSGSIASNGAQFGFEAKKLWPFERIQFRICTGE